MRTKGRDLNYLLAEKPERKKSFRGRNLEGR